MPDDWRSVAQWQKTASATEALLDLPLARRDLVTIDHWENLRLDLTLQREEALILSERGTLEGRIAKAQLTELEKATPKGQSELAWVKQKRNELNATISTKEGPAIAAQDIQARDGVLIEEIDQILRQKRREKLFSHDHPVLSVRTWADALHDLRFGRIDVKTPVIRQPHTELLGVPLMVRLMLIVAIGIAATLVALRSRRTLLLAIDRRNVPAGSPRSLLGLAFARDLLDIAIPAGMLLIVLVSVRALTADLPFFALLSGQIILAGLTVIFAHWLGQSIFHPAFPPAQLVRIPDGRSDAAIGLMTMLGLAMAADQLVDYADQQPGNLAAAGSIFFFLIVLAAGFLAWRLAQVLNGATGAKIAKGKNATQSRNAGNSTDMVQLAARILTAVAAVSVAAALLGYVALARYLLMSTLASFAAVCTTLFLYRSLTEASELLFRNRESAGSRYIQLLPLGFGFVLFLLTLPVVAIMWGVSAEKIIDWMLTLKNGVAIGQIRVSFGSVMTFAMVFVLGYALTRWLQRLLHFAVLDRLHIEAGARAALLTGFGYLGLTLSALVAITAAGLDLSSLAFIAGALSVGVGFGLQSVVANFVSGIILLIERPIKVGDWIEVGTYSGHVRKIAFRSTHIETFDRHEVIIPNTDLISGSVTNLTYGGSLGRITLPVGIAYGSDVEMARTVLLGALSGNRRVLSDPAPSVVLDNLGDSAINLKALCFVANVNERQAVRSELYFALLHDLEKAGIGIPFPQREIRLRTDGADARRAPPSDGAATTP
ncbi:mechanosensitive ion channel MscS [Novosphingobium sp. Rr 2-17]|uniref:mechanosensitive ion channel family protein n=1 Tax=Novosphingobium sp. Rr 2-17 TaxID=555793 RepID=UPI000269A4ED|nr:mechanosensitive ion channel domain-containing protein [Novosphingobium sp. Rr 2-17]EIZ79653.1 mechanosensitive ion channel MscS [Novosphingobium sp. Rr 2-17]